MNTFLLNFIKPVFNKAIKCLTKDEVAEILSPNFDEGCWDYFQSLAEGDGVTFYTQFPSSATQLPLFSFVLGNLGAPQVIQTFSYTDEEYPDDTYTNLLHLAQNCWVLPKQLEGNEIHQKLNSTNLNNHIYESSVIIGCYATNKSEVSWLMLLMDYLLKMYSSLLATLGVIDLNTSQTDLRLQQELFPLEVPTRIITVTFKYEKTIPVIPGLQERLNGDFKLNLR